MAPRPGSPAAQRVRGKGAGLWPGALMPPWTQLCQLEAPGQAGQPWYNLPRGPQEQWAGGNPRGDQGILWGVEWIEQGLGSAQAGQLAPQP